MKLNIAVLALTLVSGLGGPAFAAGVGEALPLLKFKDQAGAERTLDASVRRIYANASRGGDALMKKAAPTQAALDAQRAIALAEISQAPGFVKYLIRKSLKDRPYATWIDESGATRALLPYKDGDVSVIELDQGRITAVRHLGSVEALRRELDPAPAAAPSPPAAK